MKKRILLIGYNFHPEPTGIGKYSGEMIHWFAKNGYDCTVITAYPYYPYWKVQDPYSRNKLWYKTEQKFFNANGSITIHRCPMYVPAKPSGMKRVLLDFSFLVSAALKLLQLSLGKKFDLVFVVAPSFQFGLLGILYKRLRQSKFLYHIQDMQIEAARDLQLIKSKKILSLLFKIEKYIFNTADIISSIADGMALKIEQKSNKKVLLFPNWTDISLFYPIADRATLKEEFGFKSTDKIILYSGAIGEKQGLESILYTANTYKAELNIKFIICGSGPYKQRLQELAAELNLSNVVFLPLQDFENFNRFLNLADLHLVIQKSSASDLVMPSKLTTILSVGGLALITADSGSDLYNLVREHNIGLVIKPDDQDALNNGIQEAITMDNERVIRNTRKYAETYLSLEGIMNKLKTNVGL
ncbi:colanic acid biosynthesis glycosyltransferase WcaI [Hymenobacter sp. UV11]|uniref:WcaI family glycosyltransferase n=1 Tax=Hymenobacter sp. UV11 TaxID=1849735 RepID=UPI001060D8E9|nr:WcaI family glycosyltransferase [Hymenobacter sp. UV11]TDN39591.1 glycosyltransferase WbuB [Hymenobacter sp. UV11]TFZ63337.1 colanic acid biosynthesis glycosyltransferase WcaI [Hymenobacter sp. UV11]